MIRNLKKNYKIFVTHQNYYGITSNFLAKGLSTLKKEDVLLENDFNLALPYDKIPGPKSFQEFFQFLPGGKFYNISYRELQSSLQQTYGNIVRIKGFFRKKDVIYLFDPKDFEIVHRTEGKYPIRNTFQMLRVYRSQNKTKNSDIHGGLLSSSGPEWESYRKMANPVLLTPNTVKQYISAVDTIAVEFMEKIKRERGINNQVSASFGNDTKVWALESITRIALDTRLNAFTNLDPSSEESQFIKNLHDFTTQSYKLEVQFSLWKYFNTPVFKKQMITINKLTKFVEKRVDDRMEKLNNIKTSTSNPNDGTNLESILQKLIRVDRKSGETIAFDMIIAGAETTGSLVIGFLYLLAKNPDKQQKLREEICQILKQKNSKLTAQTLNNIPYLRACFKEATRLKSVIFGNVRATGKDVVLHGYQIPKKTYVITCNMYCYYDKNFFAEPTKFLPERWLVKENDCSEYPSAKNVHSFAYLPFGYGVRSCIGRRLAQLEVEVLIARLVRNFNIDWRGDEELQYKNDIIYAPVGDMPFCFKDVEY